MPSPPLPRQAIAGRKRGTGQQFFSDKGSVQRLVQCNGSLFLAGEVRAEIFVHAVQKTP
jgi:hypothetical protein